MDIMKLKAACRNLSCGNAMAIVTSSFLLVYLPKEKSIDIGPIPLPDLPEDTDRLIIKGKSKRLLLSLSGELVIDKHEQMETVTTELSNILGL